jgi:methyltransferase
MWISIGLLAFVTAQRLAELMLAQHNTRALIAKGGREIGAQHYPYMVALHAAGWPACGSWHRGDPWNPSMACGLRRTADRSPVGDRDAKGPVDDADHRAAGGATRAAVAPIASSRTRIMWWSSARSRCCRSRSACLIFAAVFSVLNALMLNVRITAEDRALRDAMFLK